VASSKCCKKWRSFQWRIKYFKSTKLPFLPSRQARSVNSSLLILLPIVKILPKIMIALIPVSPKANYVWRRSFPINRWHLTLTMAVDRQHMLQTTIASISLSNSIKKHNNNFYLSNPWHLTISLCNIPDLIKSSTIQHSSIILFSQIRYHSFKQIRGP